MNTPSAASVVCQTEPCRIPTMQAKGTCEGYETIACTGCLGDGTRVDVSTAVPVERAPSTVGWASPSDTNRPVWIETEGTQP